MNRRKFVAQSAKVFALLGAAPVFSAISKKEYESLTSKKISYRFVVASDGHYGQSKTEYQAFFTDAIKWIKNEHHQKKLDFVFFNGDLVHDDISLLPDVKKYFDSVSIPYYVSRGNHDRCEREVWRQTWGYDANHTFVIDKNAFIILDTSNVRGEYICSDVDWLSSSLDKYKNHNNLFVFMHITPRKWTGAGVDCERVTKLFAEQKNLRAIFHGHDHNEDSFKELAGKHYFFDSHIGGNWGTDYRGYRVVEITSDNNILTYQVNPAQEKVVNETRLQVHN